MLHVLEKLYQASTLEYPALLFYEFHKADANALTATSVDYIIADVSLSGSGIEDGTKLSDSGLTGIYTAAVDLGEGTYSDIKLTYNEKEYIVEADGAQHFKDSIFSKLNKHTYEDIKKRDQLKDKLADSHNIIMIRIDCRMSDPNYIKDSVLSSVLSSVFDLSNVDWNYCHVESLNSLVRQACNLYKNGYKNVEILRELKISSPTLIRYLKTGSNLGWCNYINPLKKKILVYDKITMEKKYVFNSSTECSDYLSELFGSPFKRTMITSVCNGYKKSYKGFIFKYES